jgi:hypothetical protein
MDRPWKRSADTERKLGPPLRLVVEIGIAHCLRTAPRWVVANDGLQASDAEGAPRSVSGDDEREMRKETLGAALREDPAETLSANHSTEGKLGRVVYDQDLLVARPPNGGRQMWRQDPGWGDALVS